MALLLISVTVVLLTVFGSTVATAGTNCPCPARAVTFWLEVPLVAGCELLSSSLALLLAEELQGAIKWRGKELQHQVLFRMASGPDPPEGADRSKHELGNRRKYSSCKVAIVPMGEDRFEGFSNISVPEVI